MIPALFDWMNNLQILYFVPWGYENLPEPSGGDVDLCVHPKDYDMVAYELRLRGYVNSNCPRYSDSHKHAQFTQEGEVTIDMFTSFCFGYKGRTTVLNIDPFVCTPIKRGKYWTAHPSIETLFTALRVVGGRSDCVKRLEKYLEM